MTNLGRIFNTIFQGNRKHNNIHLASHGATQKNRREILMKCHSQSSNLQGPAYCVVIA